LLARLFIFMGALFCLWEQENFQYILLAGER
jgi:hypothetical protein